MTQVGSFPAATRTVACTGTAAQCGSADGWYVDLPDTGERVNVEMKLRSGDAWSSAATCRRSAPASAGGYSWLNYFNFKSGLAIASSAGLVVSEQVSNSLIVGLTVVTVGGPNGVPKAIITTSDGGSQVKDVARDAQVGNAKRTSWREVLSQ